MARTDVPDNTTYLSFSKSGQIGRNSGVALIEIQVVDVTLEDRSVHSRINNLVSKCSQEMELGQQANSEAKTGPLEAKPHYKGQPAKTQKTIHNIGLASDASIHNGENTMQ